MAYGRRSGGHVHQLSRLRPGAHPGHLRGTRGLRRGRAHPGGAARGAGGTVDPHARGGSRGRARHGRVARHGAPGDDEGPHPAGTHYLGGGIRATTPSCTSPRAPTGEPKMALTTHGALLANLAMGPPVLPFGPQDRTIAFLPSAHIAQRVVIELLPLMDGMPVTFSESLLKLPQEMKAVRPTILLAPPRMWERIYSSICTEMRKRPALRPESVLGSAGAGPGRGALPPRGQARAGAHSGAAASGRPPLLPPDTRALWRPVAHRRPPAPRRWARTWPSSTTPSACPWWKATV